MQISCTAKKNFAQRTINPKNFKFHLLKKAYTDIPNSNNEFTLPEN